ncbi:MAG: cobalamin transport system substrate-binding protein [Thermotogaceae bacterium]|nr:cobalamin transport system substrate-binding protein [Thermotogaceae bacterium]MDN5338096.1 cobalamin transport system substrate-binding protein [Thermotogaceae bacterium]
MRKLVLVFTLILISLIAFSYPVSLVDDIGRVVTFEEEPQRIISAAPVATDYLVKLGIADKIVGVTTFDTYKEAEDIGNMVPLNLEKIVALNPDVVFTFGGFQTGEVEKLEKAGIKVFAINPRTTDDIFRTLVNMGIIFNKLELANKISNDLKSKMLDVAKKAYNIPLNKRPKVFFASIYQGTNEVWTCGQGSFLNEAISLAGGVNITGNYTGPNGWLTISMEFVISQNPDIILVPYYYEGGQEEAIKAVKSIELWKNIKAVKNNRIIPVDGNIASSPDTRLIDFIVELYNIFYGGKK